MTCLCGKPQSNHDGERLCICGCPAGHHDDEPEGCWSCADCEAWTESDDVHDFAAVTKEKGTL